MGINADATNASEAVRDIVGQEFEILGTNAVSADCRDINVYADI